MPESLHQKLQQLEVISCTGNNECMLFIWHYFKDMILVFRLVTVYPKTLI